MTEQTPAPDHATVTLAGTVDKIVHTPGMPDKAQITVEKADHLYQEIRIENVLHTDQGDTVSLKPGADVDVTIAAPEESVVVQGEDEG
ncbi:MAG TPA: hypothetical protein VH079_14335 [Terriglobales bacterium]|jgi:uncharacterized cupredoxin-like copper-binding protein|nr:hypothetical protein [Terriglobales bacterium]